MNWYDEAKKIGQAPFIAIGFLYAVAVGLQIAGFQELGSKANDLANEVVEALYKKK